MLLATPLAGTYKTHLHLSKPLLELCGGRIDNHLRPAQRTRRLTSVSAATVPAGITSVPATALPTTLGERDGGGNLVVGVSRCERGEGRDGSGELPEGGVRVDSDGGGQCVRVVVWCCRTEQC